MATGLPRGNIRGCDLFALTLSPVSVANATSAEQTFSFKGLRTTDFVSIIKPSAQAGLGIVNSRVSAADVLAVTFMNCTSATITPTASEVYTLLLNRSEYIPLATAIG